MAEKANSAALPDILVVGIAGGSGGGKTTLTSNLIRRFGDKVCIVHHDNYYRAHDDLTYEERTRLNYDCPEAFETEMMIEHLRLLKQGRSIHCPVYDFKVHNRSGETIEIEPRPVILVEGILIFAEPALSDLMDIRVFVDADADVCCATPKSAAARCAALWNSGRTPSSPCTKSMWSRRRRTPTSSCRRAAKTPWRLISS